MNVDEKKIQPEFMKLLFTTVDGKTKCMEINYDGVKEFLAEGYFIDGSSVSGFTRVNSSDLLLKPSSTQVISDPLDFRVKMMLCNIYDVSGTPHELDSKRALHQILLKARQLGVDLQIGAELEFFLLESNTELMIASDMGGYCDTTPSDKSLYLRRKIVRALNTMDIPTTAHHHEVARGQHEICLKHGHAINIADSIVLARLVIADIAYQNLKVATFMPKPFMKMNGSGLHLHQSLWDTKKNTNLFASDHAENLSELAKQYIAGIIHHAGALSALVAPTINSYKRLTPGFEAPTKIAWGYRNRSAMIRIPTSRGKSKRVRIEYRCPDPLCNPYLAIAGILAAGIDGITKGLEPPNPTDRDLFKEEVGTQTLPYSLEDAISELKKDQVIRNGVGKSIIDEYTRIRQSECDEYKETTGNLSCGEITQWEIQRYLHSV